MPVELWCLLTGCRRLGSGDVVSVKVKRHVKRMSCSGQVERSPVKFCEALSGRACSIFSPIVAGISRSNWHDSDSVARFRLSCREECEIGLRGPTMWYLPSLPTNGAPVKVSLLLVPLAFARELGYWSDFDVRLWFPIGVLIQAADLRKRGGLDSWAFRRHGRWAEPLGSSRKAGSVGISRGPPPPTLRARPLPRPLRGSSG